MTTIATKAAAPANPRRFRILTRKAAKRLATFFALLLLATILCHHFMIRMPGSSFTGPLPPLTAEQSSLASHLRDDVRVLAGDIGRRNTFRPQALADAAGHIKHELEAAGYGVRELPYASDGMEVHNIEAVLPGSTLPQEIVVVGAHYDTCHETPGADDNASGVAATLALARRLAGKPQARTVRFVFFVNEEPPNFWTGEMGSLVYAKACKAAGDNVSAMISLESIGYYDTKPGSQHYPPPLSLAYPDRGDFIAIVGNLSSRSLTLRAVEHFRETTKFPCEGAALPTYLPGVGWSDHWSFWHEGYPAIMFTGTATFRNPNYHQPTDTPDTLDYERTARVVEGIERVVQELATR